MSNVSEVASQLAPLCYLPDGCLVCYQWGDILLLREGIVQKRFSLFSGLKERLLGRSRLLYRLLRLGIRAAMAIDERHVLLSVGRRLCELDVQTGACSAGSPLDQGFRPLSFTQVSGISGFDDAIYYGGYELNLPKHPVSIYQRKGVDQWERVYTFPQGTINHIHAIVPDPYRQCLWVFTGDVNEASAIWKFSDHFRQVERTVCNDQKYRACVAFALPEGLLYATDAPYTEDFIYLFNPDSCDLKELFPLAGSCIYGCRWKGHYVFSSTVEGDGRNLTLKDFLFDRKRGAGIKDEQVHLYMGNPAAGFRELHQETKDSWPFYTFQFGVFKFPAGESPGDALYFHPVATRCHDLSLMAYRA